MGDRIMDIAEWRRKIDEIDRKLVEMLNQRAEAAQEIGRLKRVAELPIYEPDRERIVLTQVQEMNRGPLLHRHLFQIYERIMDVMRNIQKDEIVGDSGTLPSGDTELDADTKD
jgi:chorismate mutase